MKQLVAFFRNKPFLIYLFLFFAIGIFVFRDFLLLRKLYMFDDVGSDTMVTFYPSMMLGYFTKGLHWTFQSGMGMPAGGSETNWIDTICGAIVSPQSLIGYFFNAKNIAYYPALNEFVKIGISGLFFYFYLQAVPFSKYVSIIGALIFAFSGIMIKESAWYINTNTFIYLALTLLGIEKYIKEKKWLFLLLVLTISLRAIGIYFIYIFALFFIIYAFFRCIDENIKEPFFYIKGIGVVLASVLINFDLIYPSLEATLSLPRVTGNISKIGVYKKTSPFGVAYLLYYVNEILSFFSNDMLGTGFTDNTGKNDFIGWKNYYEAPSFYMGLLTLLLVPQFWQNATKKQRILYLSFLLIWLIPVVFPYFRRAIFLFFGDYFRTLSFCIAFPFLFLALKSLEHLRKNKNIYLISLIITLLVLIVILYYPYSLKFSVKNIIRDAVVLFLVLYFLFLVLLKTKLNPKIVFTLLLCLVCIELAYLNRFSIRFRRTITTNEFYHSRKFYNDYTVEALQFLKKYDKGFYRTEKDYSSGTVLWSSFNDAQVQGYFGTSSYNSFQQPYYSRFLQITGAIKTDFTNTIWCRGVRESIPLHSIASVKYWLSKSDKPPLNYVLIHKTGDVFIYQNKNHLPLGFTYDAFLTEKELTLLPDSSKQKSLLSAVFLDSIGVKYCKLKHCDFKDTMNLSSAVENLRKDTLVISYFKQDSIVGNITLQTPKLLFLSIPFDKNWKAKVNNKDNRILLANGGLCGIYLEKGKHTIQMYYQTPVTERKYRWVSFSTLIVVIGIFFFTRKKELKNE